MDKIIKVKRPVSVKTVVTDNFKKQAMEELNKEIHLLDSQIIQLELQNKQIHDQAAGFGTGYGEENIQQIQQALNEIAGKLQQMSLLKQEIQSQRENISHLGLNNLLLTGSLENYVELRVGDNIYDRFKNAEIIIKDGVIQEIRY